MDRRSEVSGLSRLTTGIGLLSRRCCGDFCDYDEQDEICNMNDDPELNCKANIRKARNMYKRNFGVGIQQESHLPDDKTQDEQADDWRPDSWEDDYLQRKISGEYKIPQKSIEMARDEIRHFDFMDENGKKNVLAAAPLSEADYVSEKIESKQLLKWPAPLLHWWWRMGVGKRCGSKVPVSSAFSIGASILDSNGSLRTNELETLTKSKKKKKKDFDENKRQESLDALLRGDIPNSRDLQSNKILYDLAENPFGPSGERRHVGQITTFYHDAKVCPKCYGVYRELDYLRDRDRKLRLKQKHKASVVNLDAEAVKQRDKRIEKKFFEQRKFVSRLSKLKPTMIETPHNAHMLAAESICSVDTRYHQSSVLSDVTNDGSSIYHSCKNAIRGAPKGALPPRPWQLHEYEQHQQGSSFVRNIGQKAEEVSRMFDYEKKVNAKKETMSMSQDTDQVSDPNMDWNTFINQDFNRSRSSGGIGQGQRLPPIREQDSRPKKVNPKSFDSNRLLHPWQRYLSELKKGTPQDEADAMEKADRQSNATIEREPPVFSKKPVRAPASDSSALQRAISGISDKKQDFDVQELSRYRAITKAKQEQSISQNSVLVTSQVNYVNAAPANSNRIAIKSTFAKVKAEDLSTAKSKSSSVVSANLPGYGNDDDDDEDDDADDDDGIGWSPFCVRQD